ncbi:MAG: PEGA domain-containing protein, partial [Myxococcota bacterium]
VLITRLGGVKVIDFGIAKHEARHAETVVGTVKGKVAYMSPEQLLRKKLDRRSDVFSLGVVLYELLTGEQCFKGDSALQQMMAVEKARYTPVHLLRQKVPPDVEAVVDKMLALRPKDRFQSAKEVIAAIERLMSKYGTVLASDLEDYVNPMFETRELPEPVVQKSEEDERWESDVFPLPHADDQSIPEDVKEITLPGDSGGDEIAEARGPKPKAKPNKPKPAPKRANVADTRVKKRRWPLVFASMLVAGVGLGLGALQWVWSGSLDVRTIPPGATVYLDGVAVGQTPTQIDTLRPEVVYELQVELEGYDPIARSVVLEQAQPSALELIHLDPSAPKGAGMLTITSDPPGARVQVVGRSGSEVAPARFVLPAGPAHQLTADLDGFSQANLEVKLDDGERATRRLVLIASFSRLSLNSEPKAEVFVGEKSLGSTPLESVELPAGENILVLRNERLGIEKQLRLDLPPGALLEENVVLSKGTLEFVANPWADVYVDGRKVGTTTMLHLAVYEGAHQVRFVNRDIKKESTVDVIVVAGESTRLNAGWN